MRIIAAIFTGAIMFTLLGLILFIGLGCTSTYVHHQTFDKDGKITSDLNIHRRTCISKVEMPDVQFNADGTAKMSGYNNDGGNGVVASSVEAACKGAVKGAISK